MGIVHNVIICPACKSRNVSKNDEGTKYTCRDCSSVFTVETVADAAKKGFDTLHTDSKR